jgi:hypothetical protein|nr:MAG TPA: hypothetical protein [Caudoviricetes sp.]
MKELYKYEGYVRIICTDGDILEGSIDDYTSALDNEPDEESITIREESSKRLIEIMRSEIAEIEEVV